MEVCSGVWRWGSGVWRWCSGVWREERRRQEGGEEKGERLLDRYGKMEERKGEKRKNT